MADHDHDKEKDHPHIHGFDQAAENLVKKVKQALEEAQGCRVMYMLLLDCKIIYLLVLHKYKTSAIFFVGLWSSRCSEGCWELSYFSSWLKHFCGPNGQFTLFFWCSFSFFALILITTLQYLLTWVHAIEIGTILGV